MVFRFFFSVDEEDEDDLFFMSLAKRTKSLPQAKKSKQASNDTHGSGAQCSV